MGEYINPLWEDRDKKIKQFEQGIANSGVDYLKQINKQVRIAVQEKHLKTKDYVEMQKEQLGEDNDGKQD